MGKGRNDNGNEFDSDWQVDNDRAGQGDAMVEKGSLNLWLPNENP
jgi:hypothetical protein